MDGFAYEEKPSFNRVASMAGKAGEAGKRVFWKNWARRAGKG